MACIHADHIVTDCQQARDADQQHCWSLVRLIATCAALPVYAVTAPAKSAGSNVETAVVVSKVPVTTTVMTSGAKTETSVVVTKTPGMATATKTAGAKTETAAVATKAPATKGTKTENAAVVTNTAGELPVVALQPQPNQWECAVPQGAAPAAIW